MGVHFRLLFMLIAFNSAIQNCYCLVWEDPPFDKDSPLIHPSVTFETSDAGQIIYMDEEIDGDVYIAKINYKGSSIPKIGRIDAGNNLDLGALVEKRETDPEDENFYIIVKNRQDYETLSMQRYIINIEIVEGSDKRENVIYLNINNIDDNTPSIQLSPCEIPELYEGLSNCTYTVTDADGDISINVMTFKIDENSIEKDLFQFEEKRFNDDPYKMEITINVIEQLDFDKIQLHIFTLEAFDSLPNIGTAKPIVQVKDMPNMPPKWTSIFATQRFNEKTPQTFKVTAIDGDTQINIPIKYRLNDAGKEFEFLHIGEDSGILVVDPIDRDAEEREVFNFEIVAYKSNNFTWITSSEVALIVIDINDNYPNFNQEEFSISIDEEKYQTINFEPLIFCHDIDLGENAEYEVVLKSVEPETAADAFLVIPNGGYQKQEIKITIVNASMLDYDDVAWQKVVFKIISTERTTKEKHSNETTITINLNNWNDEEPIFAENEYTATFDETEGKGFFVATVMATDRDIDDQVIHSITGSAEKLLSINNLTGEIYISEDNAFDYQRQNQIIVQVKAMDTLGEPYHTKYVQLIINLIDVNNKSPQIQMPRETPSVKENVPMGHEITEINGTDPDTTANLTFSINWDLTYATKQGLRANKADYENCIDIISSYPNEKELGFITGVLVANEIKPNHTIDYEKFELLYLVIRLEDHNQVMNEGITENTLIIAIEDVNDNPPEWVDGTLTVKRSVREVSVSGVPIGTVRAIDIDGPEFNVVRYSLKAINDTPNELVEIDSQSGDLKVLGNRLIDADVPPRYNLYYTVSATDCPVPDNYEQIEDNCHITDGDIEIEIIDTNNKFPIPLEDEFDSTVSIEEHVEFANITTIKSEDLDRDVAFHNVTYTINYQNQDSIRNLFAVEPTTGLVKVELKNGAYLERDYGITDHDIEITLTDNYMQIGETVMNTATTKIKVILLDINDNAPQLPPSSSISWHILEDTAENTPLSPIITAKDIDDPDTDNALVQYKTLNSTAIISKDGINPDLFLRMESPDNISGIVYTDTHLKGLWGTYEIFIEAYDLGIPRQWTQEKYILTVEPHNYMAPIFIFPKQGDHIRLKKETSIVGGILQLTNGNTLSTFKAQDDDGLEAGDVSFSIIDSDQAREYFDVENLPNNECRLVLIKDQQNFQDTFQITLRAIDNGKIPKSSDVKFTIKFIPMIGEPFFDPNTAKGSFTELEQGLKEEQTIPPADDLKNQDCGGPENECFNIYYHIIDGNNENLFVLEKTEGILTLNNIELNRENATEYILKIAATNSEQIGGIPSLDSILTYYIDVLDHDPKPRFSKYLYPAGISVTDGVGKSLFTVNATHTENLKITYEITENTMKVDPTMENVKDTAFILDKDSGELKLNFQPVSFMMGKLEFNITATDSEKKTDHTEAKVFLITDIHKISFIFFNTTKEVSDKESIIVDIFTSTFGYSCTIDDIQNAVTSDGVNKPNQTEVKTHFRNTDDSPIEASVIEVKKNDASLMQRLQLNLDENDLRLEDFASNAKNESESLERMLRIILIVVTTVLGALCIVLLIAYCVRTRSLNKRLQNLSTIKFGSQDSGLNRIGVSVPGTNKHAIEGSNPVWNEEIKPPQLDTISTGSGDSDLIGIENDPQFSYDNHGIKNEDSTE
ncbi:cadherin-AgCad1-like [Arctopsyche grandis]|uniref:cadherin-AgCad1-like n=1 Tax=Arctopsyche grandis TaxID=121162 RepID=UPI00406D7B26